MVSAWVLIPLPNHNPAFFPSPQALRNLTGPDQDLKLNPQSHILFYKVFFSPSPPPSPYPRQIYVAQTLIVPPQALIFILSPFSKLGTESCSSQHKEEGWCCEMLYLQIFIFTFIFHFHFQFHFHFSLSLNLIKVEPSGRQTNVSLINTLVLHTFLIITSHSQYIIVLLTLLNTI